MDLKFYSVTSGNAHNSYGLSRYNDILQSFDFIDNHRCYGNTSTDFSYFCYYCYSLTKLPDSLDTSSGTGFSYFCTGCYSLTKLPDNLDTSSGTDFYNFCAGCYALTKANIILPAAYNITTLNASNKLTVASMRYIADNAPTTSGHALTIGNINIERAN